MIEQKCDHLVICNKAKRGCCELGLLGGQPSRGSCLACKQNTNKYSEKDRMSFIQLSNHGITSIDAIKPILDKSKWPLAAKVIAKLAVENEKGVGDTIERIIGPGGDVYKKWYKKLMGKDCGCSSRKTMLNVRYPYITKNIASLQISSTKQEE